MDISLINLESLNKVDIPRPYPLLCVDPTYGWNKSFETVRLPFSILCPQRAVIKENLGKLLHPLNSPTQIVDSINAYCPKARFRGFIQFFENELEAEIRKEYLQKVIPFMARLALKANEIITQTIPILCVNQIGSVTMSQEQVATLLANAFFCTFPCRQARSKLPLINFNRLFNCRSRIVFEKMRCIMDYFHKISIEMPNGVILIRRQHSERFDWSTISIPLIKPQINVNGNMLDDEFESFLRVDFANKYIGGGVLTGGCVQEEIFFITHPELIISMLLCERMAENEAIAIVGAQKFSDFSGYASSFKWKISELPLVPNRDHFKRHNSEVVAVDALKIDNNNMQYSKDAIDRELLKAYTGFCDIDNLTKTLATGNWGCGAFGGDPYLKSLIQLMACSFAKRNILYFTFGNNVLSERLIHITNFLVNHKVTVGQLYLTLTKHMDIGREESLFDYIEKIFE